MQKTDNLLDSMSRVLFRNMSSASTPVSIDTPALSMKLQKSSAADVGGKAITTQHADIILPTNLGTQGSEQDISIKVRIENMKRIPARAMHFCRRVYHSDLHLV